MVIRKELSSNLNAQQEPLTDLLLNTGMKARKGLLMANSGSNTIQQKLENFTKIPDQL